MGFPSLALTLNAKFSSKCGAIAVLYFAGRRTVSFRHVRLRRVESDRFISSRPSLFVHSSRFVSSNAPRLTSLNRLRLVLPRRFVGPRLLTVSGDSDTPAPQTRSWRVLSARALSPCLVILTPPPHRHGAFSQCLVILTPRPTDTELARFVCPRLLIVSGDSDAPAPQTRSWRVLSARAFSPCLVILTSPSHTHGAGAFCLPAPPHRVW